MKRTTLIILAFFALAVPCLRPAHAEPTLEGGQGDEQTESTGSIVDQVLSAAEDAADAALKQSDSVITTVLSAAEKAADRALEMIGIPYKYRGASPKGFDCSGLVRYSFGLAGIDLPHGTRELRKMLTKLEPGALLQKGDLLFFTERRGRVSHVAIYLGDGLFVHAPRRREQVRIDSLSDTHWKKRFTEARRVS